MNNSWLFLCWHFIVCIFYEGYLETRSEHFSFIMSVLFWRGWRVIDLLPKHSEMIIRAAADWITRCKTHCDDILFPVLHSVSYGLASQSTLTSSLFVNLYINIVYSIDVIEDVESIPDKMAESVHICADCENCWVDFKADSSLPFLFLKVSEINSASSIYVTKQHQHF